MFHILEYLVHTFFVLYSGEFFEEIFFIDIVIFFIEFVFEFIPIGCICLLIPPHILVICVILNLHGFTLHVFIITIDVMIFKIFLLFIWTMPHHASHYCQISTIQNLPLLVCDNWLVGVWWKLVRNHHIMRIRYTYFRIRYGIWISRLGNARWDFQV